MLLRYAVDGALVHLSGVVTAVGSRVPSAINPELPMLDEARLGCGDLLTKVVSINSELLKLLNYSLV